MINWINLVQNYISDFACIWIEAVDCIMYRWAVKVRFGEALIYPTIVKGTTENSIESLALQLLLIKIVAIHWASHCQSLFLCVIIRMKKERKHLLLETSYTDINYWAPTLVWLCQYQFGDVSESLRRQEWNCAFACYLSLIRIINFRHDSHVIKRLDEWRFISGGERSSDSFAAAELCLACLTRSAFYLPSFSWFLCGIGCNNSINSIQYLQQHRLPLPHKYFPYMKSNIHCCHDATLNARKCCIYWPIHTSGQIFGSRYFLVHLS